MTNIEIIKSLAKLWKIDIVGKNKAELIRAIQSKEGFLPCFETKTECGEYDCAWRTDCLPTSFFRPFYFEVKE